MAQTTAASVETLRDFPLFRACSDEEVRRIAELGRPLKAACGDTLAREGEAGTDLHLIRSGEAVASVAGREVARFGPMDLFGEVALVGGGSRSATVVADSEMDILVLNGDDFAALLERYPGIARALLAMLAERLRSANSAIAASESAISEGLVVHKVRPLNAETAIPELIGGVIMPTANFYIRNNFDPPVLDPETWRLRLGGEVDNALSLSLAELRALPKHTQVVTLECAGNGRSLLEPPAEGEQWRLGAVSTAEWTGVPLSELLDRAGVRPSAREVVFAGADSGVPSGTDRVTRFERSLSLAQSRDPDIMVAYAMNGAPLPLQHGFPVRLIVPDWYAVASVKWLTEIRVIDQAFTGHFQTNRYVYYWDEAGSESEPVRLQRVRALITEPREGEKLGQGQLAVRGVAWSGSASIRRVEVQVGDGDWQDARLVGTASPHGWQWWELIAPEPEPGTLTLRARATDEAGNTQPPRAPWNQLGYGNNAIQAVTVRVH